MWEWLEEQGDGNRSKPIYDFVYQTMNETATIPLQGDNCMMELCEAFAPSYAHAMKKRVDGVDQRIFLETVVRLIAMGELGLRDEWTKAQWPAKAADAGEGYGET